MQKKISVGIADMKLTRQEGVLITYALGSCIGITFYDPMIKLGALLHIMLPEKTNSQDSNILKYADTGIRLTLSKMEQMGARRAHIVAKIAGGSTVIGKTISLNIEKGKFHIFDSQTEERLNP